MTYLCVKILTMTAQGISSLTGLDFFRALGPEGNLLGQNLKNAFMILRNAEPIMAGTTQPEPVNDGIAIQELRTYDTELARIRPEQVTEELGNLTLRDLKENSYVFKNIFTLISAFMDKYKGPNRLLDWDSIAKQNHALRLRIQAKLTTNILRPIQGFFQSFMQQLPELNKTLEELLKR